MALNRLPSSNNLVPCGRVAIDGSLLLCCCLHPLKNVVAAFNGTQPVLTGHLEADTLSAILHGYCQAELIHRAPYSTYLRWRNRSSCRYNATMSTTRISAKIFRVASRQSKRSISSATTPRARIEVTTAHAKTSPSFPCVDAHAERASRLQAGILNTPLSLTPNGANPSASGPEPPYARPNPASYSIYHHTKPFPLIYSRSPLPEFDVAYETWGKLNAAKDNAILLHTGLSASSHAASTSLNPAPGWWEKFIGPGKALDTNQFFVICTNVLGGCYGSTGPSSLNPHYGKDSEPYGTNFPILSIFDIARAQYHLLDYMGIQKLYSSVGSSMGGMTSLATAWLHPDRVEKIVSISGTARSSPSAIAMRFAQRSGEWFGYRSLYLVCSCSVEQFLWPIPTGRMDFITGIYRPMQG